MNCKRFADMIFSHQDGRLPARERAEFDAHRRSCAACAALLADAAAVGGRLRDAATPVPAPDWDTSWRAIAAALGRPDRRRHAVYAPRWAFAAAGFLAFFLLGILAARLFLFPPRPGGAAPDDARFLYSARDYFAALQPVMADFANNDGVGTAADPSLVRRFLSDLYLLKLRAERTRDTGLQRLLADIELVLLEIAHMDRSDPQRARQIGSLIREKGIPMKMTVLKFDGRKSMRI